MVSKDLEAKRLTRIINQQMEILREETDALKVGVDEVFSRVQREVDTWINGGHVNQTSWAEMSNTIQQHIQFLIAKSVELSGPVSNRSDGEQDSFTSNITAKSPGAFTNCSTQTDEMHCFSESGDKPGFSEGEKSSQIVNMRLAILEEAVFSLKKSTEKVQKDQDKVDTVLKDFSTQQKHVNKRIQILSDSSSKSQVMQEKITEAEKINHINSLHIENLKESVTKHDSKLNGLEDASKAIYTSINELSSQLGLVQTLSDLTSVSLQELSKKKESIESRVEEMSKKVSIIEVKFNQPIVGFYAWKLLNVTRDVCAIIYFNCVESNYGGYFDKNTGIFTAPMNGLYLVSISIGSKECRKIPDFVCKQTNYEKSVDICYVTGYKTITRCIFMKTNDKISLEMKLNNYEINIWIHFSCCLITK